MGISYSIIGAPPIEELRAKVCIIRLNNIVLFTVNMAQNKSSIAYTAEEKEVLIQLILKYPIIEEKKTDATSIRRKTEAWEKLCFEYNSIASNTKVDRLCDRYSDLLN